MAAVRLSVGRCMSGGGMIHRLKQQHRELRKLGQELLALVRGEGPCAWETLSELRWRLVRLQLQHVALEERFLYRPLERSSRPRAAFLARSFIGEREAALVRFEEHFAHWNRVRIERDWPAFVASVVDLVGYWNGQMEREEARLYSLVATTTPVRTGRPQDRNWEVGSWQVRDRMRRASV
jgi:hypothetical protein